MDENKNNARNQIDDQQSRDRAIRLFTFLRELTELRTKTIRTVDQYDKVLWFNKIPREQGWCYSAAWGPVENEKQSDVWLEVKKPRLKAPPKVPSLLEPWLDLQGVQDSSLQSPKLREKIIVSVSAESSENSDTGSPTVFKNLTECPEIKPLWEQYFTKQWYPWAEEDRRLQIIQKVYTDLFSIYQKQQRLGEAYEVILGLGYLTWTSSGRHEVKRHVIAAQTNLTFDAVRGIITLGPAGEGAKPTLEQDMLEPQERPERC